MHLNLKSFGQIITLILALTSCKKLVEVSPPTTSLASASVYSNNNAASAAVTGIYSQMMGSSSFIGTASSGTMSFGVVAGLSSDELGLYPNSNVILAQAYSNSLKSTPNPLPFWTTLYNFIYLSNSAISGLTTSTAVTPGLKSQLLGESKFLRAFFNFYLINSYGDVPLVSTTSFQQNLQAARAPTSQVYQQIISDLKDAQNLLSDDFLDPLGNSTSERVRPNKAAATALLARAYLYTGAYDSAETQATKVINNSSKYELVHGLDSVFLKNSNEAIWQLQAIIPGYNTTDGYVYILKTGPNSSSNPVFLSTQLLKSFETGDERAIHWIGVDSSKRTKYYYPFKYKVKGGSSSSPPSISEYLMVLRLAEQYLIRAEARAQQGVGSLSNAAADLNLIRARAGLPPISDIIASSQPALLSSILHEKQVELFTEWGHRWLDLKRTNTANAVLGSPGNVCQSKGGTWGPNWQLYPLPLTELQTDFKLIQNPGYN
jgi:hypothetical protein